MIAAFHKICSNDDSVIYGLPLTLSHINQNISTLNICSLKFDRFDTKEERRWSWIFLLLFVWPQWRFDPEKYKKLINRLRSKVLQAPSFHCVERRRERTSREGEP